MINDRKDNLHDNYDPFKKSGLNCKMGLAKNTNLGKNGCTKKMQFSLNVMHVELPFI